MSSSLKFILIGCGKIGHRHAVQMQRVGNIIAACDIDTKAASAFSKQFEVPVYPRIEEILSGQHVADVAAICTPNGFHAAQSVALLNNGLHVLCEKPMALNVEDCRAMIKAADANSKKLIVVKQNRFNPPVVAVKKLLTENKLGKIFSVQVNCFWNRNSEYYNSNWRGTKELDGGTLFTQFSHFIDILYWLMGDITQVSAFKKNLNHQGIIEFEDTGIVNLLFESGALGAMHYTVNSYDCNMEGSITIHAEHGTVKIGGEYLNELEYQSLPGDKLIISETGNGSNNYGTYQGSMSNHDKVYDNLLQVILCNKPEHAPAIDGLKTVEIINRINNAAIMF